MQTLSSFEPELVSYQIIKPSYKLCTLYFSEKIRLF